MQASTSQAVRTWRAFEASHPSFFSLRSDRYGAAVPRSRVPLSSMPSAGSFCRVRVHDGPSSLRRAALVPQIRHDLPRPPSVITDLFGDTEVLSYAGEDGLAYIKASEWESFIRTMPHSEFPSASACICQVFFAASRPKSQKLTLEQLCTCTVAPFPWRTV